MAILQSVRGLSNKTHNLGRQRSEREGRGGEGRGREGGVSSWRCSPCFCPPFILFSFFFYSSLSLVGWLVVWLAKLGEGGEGA
jgi:hypothetical protein